MSPASAASQSDWVRAPAVAGSWYPDDPEELAYVVDGYLEAAIPVDGEPIGLVVPHAGFAFSGPVAAYGFRQLQTHDYEVAVIIASDHALPLSRPISVWAKGGFETPLGVIPVHEEVAQALIGVDERISFDPAAHEREHPIEIELPFLQRSCPECPIVPVLMGSDEESTISVLADSLIVALQGRKAVIVASSDLAHYPSYEDAQWVDRTTLGAVETGDPERLHRTIRDLMGRGVLGLSTCACGEAPIRVAMQAARGLGADTYRTLHYANSGDAAFGDRDRVVGYGAVMFWRHRAPELSAEQKSELLEAARAAIAEALGAAPSESRLAPSEQLSRLSAAFVTVSLRGELRGCIGTLRADTPLHQVVRDRAVAAATMDPRFPPLTREELADVQIEISILSPLRRIADLDQVHPGVHGLALFQEGRQGVLLPQVARERGWDRQTFLDNLCLKAGLPEGRPSATAALYAFTTLEFGEGQA